MNLVGDGTMTFTPTRNTSGPAAFNYTIEDAAGLTDTAAVAVTVTAGQRRPRSPSTTPTASDEDGTFTVGASGVLGNDTDVEDDPLTATWSPRSADGT